MIVGHVLSLLANGRLRVRVGFQTFESLHVGNLCKEFILRSPVLSAGLLVPAVERRHPILLPGTPYANLRKSVASRNYGHKDLRLWEYESNRGSNRESTALSRTMKSESPETERLSILQEYRPRPLSFQRILNNGGPSEEGGKAERRGGRGGDTTNISRVLERSRRGGSKRRGLENAGQNVVDANAALSKRGFLFST
ncbi:hypothetical protein ALC60_10639 [Trachymyrmex zeteki]|uniref:Uncharacterized protein n=1 Tax=Mycetomoellerius zeteki TaxID=64791 RepID=A0A151WRM8_9HYME|nr:hypothetical protein ALC60_10639 [Trachymyrmex zeteki]